jgi:hypothetical protein
MMTRNLIALAVASLLLPYAPLSQGSRREPCQDRQAEANKAVVARALISPYSMTYLTLKDRFIRRAEPPRSPS